MNLPRVNLRNLATIALAAAILGGCGLWPLEKRALSSRDHIRTSALKKIKSLPGSERGDIVAAMLQAISSDDLRVSNRAAEALVACGTAAVDPVINELESEDPYLRTLAVTILGDIGAPVAKIGPALVGGLNDAHPLVREEAAHALSRLGPDGVGAVPALTMTLNDADPDVREAAHIALKRLGVVVSTAPAKTS